MIEDLYEMTRRELVPRMPTHLSSPFRERGVGLPVAIFVITILAAFVVNTGYLVQDNASGRSEQIQTLRAQLIAESGANLALSELFPPAAAPSYVGYDCSDITASPSGLDADPGMAGCSVTLSCTTSGTAPNTIYTITSIGVCDGITQTVAVDAI